ncbi:hypothetical protein J6590_015328 [Homalodisca vitripennis]|nr:hypothetical protein J6590_015328 [Homalodisca vitripennis]
MAVNQLRVPSFPHGGQKQQTNRSTDASVNIADSVKFFDRSEGLDSFIESEAIHTTRVNTSNDWIHNGVLA